MDERTFPGWATYVARFGPKLGEGAWVEVPALNDAAPRGALGAPSARDPIALVTLGGLARGADLDDAASDSFARDALRMMADATALRFVVPTHDPQRLAALASAIEGWRDPFSRETRWPANIWPALRVSVQADTAHVEALLDLRASVRVVLCAPLCGPVTLARWLPRGGARWRCSACGAYAHAWGSRFSNDCPTCGRVGYLSGSHAANGAHHQPIDWVIAAGDTALHAQRFNVAWAAGLYQECETGGIPFYLDSLGARPFAEDMAGAAMHAIFDGSDVARVRRFPDLDTQGDGDDDAR